MIVHVADHVARALARMLEQYKGKPRLSGVISAGAEQAQGAEDALLDLQDERGLETAAGAQLDVLGRLLDTARGGFDDDTYRKHLRAKIQYNRSNGTTGDLLRIFRLIVPSAATLRIAAHFPAAFTLHVEGAAVGANDPNVFRFFLSARAAGVRGFVQYSLSPPAETFTLDSGPGLDVGKLAGDVT